MRRPERGSAERDALVAHLSDLHKGGHLLAYCEGVLSGYALRHRDEISDAVTEVVHEKIIDLAERRRPQPKPPILCRDCGLEVPRTGRTGRPRTSHEVCLVRPVLVAA